MLAGKVEKFGREVLGNRRCELAAVDELKLTRLFHHHVGNLAYAMADEIHSRGCGKVEEAVALGVPEIDTFAAHGDRIGLAK